MNVSIINDCKDENAKGRQVARATALLHANCSFVGVDSDLEAAGNVIDMLDAYGDAAGVIMVNVAPRDGRAKQWENGTPFGYFWFKNVLVLATIDGLTLSLVKKLALTESITVLDLPQALTSLRAADLLSDAAVERITNSQFRSFDFLPLTATYLVEHRELDGETLSLADVTPPPPAVWWVDNFGNCKTTLIKEDLYETQLTEPFSTFARYDRLKDVPDGESAIVTGSSGLDDRRFLEVVVQGNSAADGFGLAVGELVVSA